MESIVAQSRSLPRGREEHYTCEEREGEGGRERGRRERGREGEGEEGGREGGRERVMAKIECLNNLRYAHVHLLHVFLGS